MKIYNVELDKKELDFISGLEIKDLKIYNDKIKFRTNKKTLNILKNEFEYIYFENLFKNKIKKAFFNHVVTIFGCFAFVFVMIFISKTITEITFLDTDTYNEEVYKYVEDRLKKVGPFRFLDENLNNIDKELKKEFYEYEWIGITRKGTSLILEISPSFLNTVDPSDDKKMPGSLYSKKDAIIKKYHVEKGIVVIQEEQYVKKGDLLISGDIIHYDQTVEHIHPKGYVIGEVLNYYEYTIPKVITNNIRNGKISYKDYFYYKNKIIGKNVVDDSDYEEIIKRNIFDLFYVKRRYYYERENIKTIFSLDEAKSYAKTLIYKDFLSNKVNNLNNLEKIIYIKLARSSEDEKNYYFKFVVKSEESIGEFLSK